MSLLSENIKKTRLQKKITQKQLAEMTGLGITTIQGYESGKFSPKQESLEKIALALGVPAWQLSRGEQRKSDLGIMRDAYLESLSYRATTKITMTNPDTGEVMEDQTESFFYNGEVIVPTVKEEETLYKNIDDYVDYQMWKLWKARRNKGEEPSSD